MGVAEYILLGIGIWFILRTLVRYVADKIEAKSMKQFKDYKRKLKERENEEK